MKLLRGANKREKKCESRQISKKKSNWPYVGIVKKRGKAKKISDSAQIFLKSAKLLRFMQRDRHREVFQRCGTIACIFALPRSVKVDVAVYGLDDFCISAYLQLPCDDYS